VKSGTHGWAIAALHQGCFAHRGWRKGEQLS